MTLTNFNFGPNHLKPPPFSNNFIKQKKGSEGRGYQGSKGVGLKDIIEQKSNLIWD